jgi:hypothetical protein
VLLKTDTVVLRIGMALGILNNILMEMTYDIPLTPSHLLGMYWAVANPVMFIAGKSSNVVSNTYEVFGINIVIT